MTEEEFFIKNYPDSCYGDRPLSPHFDFFQDGVEFGERRNKEQLDLLSKHIVELQKQKGELTDKVKTLEEALKGYKKIVKWCDKCELEKKISVLLSCKNCPENKGGFICQKEYEDKCLAQKIQYIKELQEELKKWKDEWQEQVQKATDEGYARTLQTIQLSKAKQFIRDFLSVAIDYIDKEDKNYSLIAEAEQFLSEVENDCR